MAEKKRPTARDIQIAGIEGTIKLLPKGHPTRKIYEERLKALQQSKETPARA